MSPRWRPPTPRTWERDVWELLGARPVLVVVTVLLAAFASLAVAGSAWGRALLDAPPVDQPIRLQGERELTANVLKPGWWPGFVRSPYWLPRSSAHLQVLPVVRAGGETVFDPTQLAGTWELEASERFLDPRTGDVLPPEDITVGDRVVPVYVLRSRTPETLHDLTIHDPVQGDVEVRRALEPFAVLEVETEPFAVPLPVPVAQLPRLLLGADVGGRDVAARVAAGSWHAFTVALGAAALAGLLGLLGTTAAARRYARAARALGRARTILVTFPALLVGVVVVSVLDASAGTVVVAVGLVGAPVVARRALAVVEEVREGPRVEAARCAGVETSAVEHRFVWPAVLREVAATACTVGGAAVLVETSLAFLGVAPPSPAVSLGTVVAEARPVIDRARWVVWLPGAVITSATAGLLVAGEHLRRRGAREVAGAEPGT